MHEASHSYSSLRILSQSKTDISPIPNFMLSFNDEEVEEIKNLFQETLLSLEIDRIFSHKNEN